MDRWGRWWGVGGRGLLLRGGTSYLGHADLSAGIQEVLHIPPTLGHAELGLENHSSTEQKSNLSFLRISVCINVKQK